MESISKKKKREQYKHVNSKNKNSKNTNNDDDAYDNKGRHGDTLGIPILQEAAVAWVVWHRIAGTLYSLQNS